MRHFMGMKGSMSTYKILQGERSIARVNMTDVYGQVVP